LGVEWRFGLFDVNQDDDMQVRIKVRKCRVRFAWKPLRGHRVRVLAPKVVRRRKYERAAI
jgi:hypothetical protein